MEMDKIKTTLVSKVVHTEKVSNMELICMLSRRTEREYDAKAAMLKTAASAVKYSIEAEFNRISANKKSQFNSKLRTLVALTEKEEEDVSACVSMDVPKMFNADRKSDKMTRVALLQVADADTNRMLATLELPVQYSSEDFDNIRKLEAELATIEETSEFLIKHKSGLGQKIVEAMDNAVLKSVEGTEQVESLVQEYNDVTAKYMAEWGSVKLLN